MIVTINQIESDIGATTLRTWRATGAPAGRDPRSSRDIPLLDNATRVNRRPRETGREPGKLGYLFGRTQRAR